VPGRSGLDCRPERLHRPDRRAQPERRRHHGAVRPFDPPGAADPGPCEGAFGTGRSVLDPSRCAVR